MDKIFYKVIKYGGTWSDKIWNLAKPILTINDTVSVTPGTDVQEFFPGDLVRAEIGDTNFLLEFISNNELKILEPRVRNKDIPQNSKVNILKHLTSKFPEELVTKFELNRLSKNLESYQKVISVELPENATSGSFILSDYFSSPHAFVEIYERVDGHMEKSDVECVIADGKLTWYSMTPIPSGICLLIQLPS